MAASDGHFASGGSEGPPREIGREVSPGPKSGFRVDWDLSEDLRRRCELWTSSTTTLEPVDRCRIPRPTVNISHLSITIYMVRRLSLPSDVEAVRSAAETVSSVTLDHSLPSVLQYARLSRAMCVGGDRKMAT